jgi:CMP-N,N'-diacetyllegionaminic acid synthase
MNLIVIPARGGSKGLPNKNLQVLLGKSLIGRAILCAKQVSQPSRIVVTTDSLEIKREAEVYGAEVPFLRSAHLSDDFSTTEETLRDALEKCEELFNESYKFVIYFSPSEGFLDPHCVNRGLDMMDRDGTIESYFPGKYMFKNYWETKNLENAHSYVRLRDSMRVYSSRQKKIPIFREDTGRGLVSRPYLWKKGIRIGDRVHIEGTHDIRADLDIHDALDLKISEFVIREVGDHDFLKF